MNIKKKTVVNILLILFVLSFFVTPLGKESKIFLNRIFSFDPDIITSEQQHKITDYSWRLKDEEWNVFNFTRSKGRVVFVNFWASWRVPSIAELKSIQRLYKDYHDKVDFYIITNEEKEPVDKFMKQRGYDFTVTYLIVGDPMPFDENKVPATYIVDKFGNLVVAHEGIANWNTKKIRTLLDKLLEE